MKFVYNRPYPAGISTVQKIALEKTRNRLLAVFLCVGAPAVLYSIKSSALTMKDTISMDFTMASGTPAASNLAEAHKDQINITQAPDMNNSNSFLLFLSNLNKHLPLWLKIFFRLLFLGMLLLKLLGLGYLEILNNVTYLK
jgi:hypothetical protein